MNLQVSDFLDRIKNIKPLKELESLGFAQSTIATWKQRNTFPKANDLYKIAEFLNVDMTWLLTGELPETDLPPDEAELLVNYRQLDDATKAMIKIQIAALAV